MENDPVAFPLLDDDDLAELDKLGTRRSVKVGDYLYQQGDPTYDFFAIVSGEVEIVLASGGSEKLIRRPGPRTFLGELALLTGLRVLVSARVVEPGEVIQVPRAALRHLIATNPTLGDTILGAFP